MTALPGIESEADFDRLFQNPVWAQAAKQICLRHHVSFSEIKRVESSDHIVFLIDDSFVLKIFRPYRQCFERETEALGLFSGKTEITVPEIIATGNFESFDYLLMTQIPGASKTRADWLKLGKKEQVEFISEVALAMRRFHEIHAVGSECDWPEFVLERADSFIQRQIESGVNARVIEALPEFIDKNLKLVPTDGTPVSMHSDVHFGNLKITDTDGKWRIAGLFDFADSRRGFHEYDFLAVGLLMIQGQGDLQREFFRAYGYSDRELDETMRKRLMMLTMLYETSDLRRYALRLRPEAVDYSLEELEKNIWSFLN